MLVDDGLEEIAEHFFGDVEVGDHSVLERTNRQNAVRRTPQHSFRLEPDALDLAGRFLDGHYGGLVEHDALTFDVDEGIGRAQINRDLIRGQPGHQIHTGKFHR
jgi:hypothetical protein